MHICALSLEYFILCKFHWTSDSYLKLFDDSHDNMMMMVNIKTFFLDFG